MSAEASGHRRGAAGRRRAAELMFARVDALLVEHREALRAMDTHEELRQWAERHDMGGNRAFAAFKRGLSSVVGVDYDDVRERTFTRDLGLIASAAGHHRVVLWAAGLDPGQAADGTVRPGSFAVVSERAPGVVWHGKLGVRDRRYVPGDQVSADCAAAEKAIYMAGRVASELELDAVGLTLRLVNPRVEADSLRGAARRNNVALEVELCEQSPAVDWCVEPGSSMIDDLDLEPLREEAARMP